VAGQDAVSRFDFARLLATAQGHDAAQVKGARRPPDRPGDIRLDSSRARVLLRTGLRGVREVLRVRESGAA
jgi:dTDP-4-dehydrorhamnose reductase